MKTILIWLLLLILFASCATPKQAAINRIGLVPLPNYIVDHSTPLSGDTTYEVITSEQQFNSRFTGGAAVRRPDFGGQRVVAIAVKQPPVRTAIRFERAEITGSTMDVYTVTCNAGANSCELTPLTLATVPKSGSIKTVKFFFNTVLRATVAL